MNQKMKAVTCRKYGSPEVLKLEEVDKPTPKENEILVEVKATAVTASDIIIRSSNVPLRFKIPMRLMLGITKPRKPIIGLVFSGVVKTVGSKIKKFSQGDEVYGMTGYNLGAYAQYLCSKEIDSTTGCVSKKPRNISFVEVTSAIYGGSLALQFMDMGNIKAGQNILVYGASGTSGTIAVQYGKYLGATVTAVCSGKNIDFVKSLGADHVIDYTTTYDLENNEKFDFILDSVGKNKTSKLKQNCRKALTKNGKYTSIDNGALQLSSTRLNFLASLIEGGKIKPVVDKVFPFEEIVAAHRYVEAGHKKGGVAITINE